MIIRPYWSICNDFRMVDFYLPDESSFNTTAQLTIWKIYSRCSINNNGLKKPRTTKKGRGIILGPATIIVNVILFKRHCNITGIALIFDIKQYAVRRFADKPPELLGVLYRPAIDFTNDHTLGKTCIIGK